MSQETSSSRYSVPRTRRVYSAQFKADLIAACLQPGASIAATAREHGMNANVLHRWLREHRLGLHQTNCDAAHAAACDTAVQYAAGEPILNEVVRLSKIVCTQHWRGHDAQRPSDPALCAAAHAPHLHPAIQGRAGGCLPTARRIGRGGGPATWHERQRATPLAQGYARGEPMLTAVGGRG